MKNINLFKTVIVFSFFFAFLNFAYSQTQQEAVDALKKGMQFKENGNLQQAIKYVEEALEIADSVGPDAEEFKVKAGLQISKLYFDYGVELAGKKEFDQAIEQLIKAEEAAIEYNRPNIKQKAQNIKAKLYRIKGVKSYSAGNYDEAIQHYDKAIASDSTYAKAYFYKALVYKKQDKDTEFINLIDESINIAEEHDDSETLEKANKLAKNYYYNKGVKAKKATNYDQALEAFKKSVEYKEYEQGYYLIGLVYNETQKYDQALEALYKGLELVSDKGSDIVSKFYFEQGRAYQGKNNKSEACAAYKKVTSGSYQKSAQYQMNHILKCQ